MNNLLLKTIFSVFLSIGLYNCNPSPQLNSTNKYNGLMSFIYVNEYASISTLLLTGTLLDGNGLALDSATILISNNYSSYSFVQAKASVSKNTVTNSNGEFSLYLKEGKFNAKISKSNGDYLGSITVVLNNPNDLPIVESQEGQFAITNFKLSSISSGSTPITTTPTTAVNITKNPSSEYLWGSFTDNQDGTINFIKSRTASPYNGTDLFWMKCSVGQTYSNGECLGNPSTHFYCNTGDNSCDNGDGNPTINPNSPIYQACNNLTLLRRTWRVPKLMELSTMLLCDGNLALNPGQCANVGISPTFSAIIGTGYIGTASYWTSEYQAGTGFAYMVDFTFGVNQLEKDKLISLRCVSDP
jgi:hypothetical protein